PWSLTAWLHFISRALGTATTGNSDCRTGNLIVADHIVAAMKSLRQLGRAWGCVYVDCRCSFPSAMPMNFVIFVSGTREEAESEKPDLTDYLCQTTGLKLSENKTRISDLTEGFELLGHRVRRRCHVRCGI